MSSSLPSTALDAPPDALGTLLSRVVDYEKAGAVISEDLLKFGLAASALVIATGLLALALPSPDAIRHGHFFLLLGGAAADLKSLIDALALPAIGCGVALIVLDLVLMGVRTTARWRTAVVAQAVVGGVAGTLCTLLLALIALNLAIWIALMVLLGALFALIIVSLLSGL